MVIFITGRSKALVLVLVVVCEALLVFLSFFYLIVVLDGVLYGSVGRVSLSLICNMKTVRPGLFRLPLGDIGRLRLRLSLNIVFATLLILVNPKNVPLDMCTQRRFRLDCAFAQSDQNLRCVHFG